MRDHDREAKLATATGPRRSLAVVTSAAPAPPAPVGAPLPAGRRLRRRVRSLVHRALAGDVPYVVREPTALGERRRDMLRAIGWAFLASGRDESGWTPREVVLDPAGYRFVDDDGRTLAITLVSPRESRVFRVLGPVAMTYSREGAARPEDEAFIAKVASELSKSFALRPDAGEVARTLLSRDAAEIAIYPRDMRVELRPTLACDHHCAFCNSVDRSVENAVHGAADVRANAAAWERWSVYRAIVSGGEPTLLKDLASIVRELAAHGLDVELQTNGMALAEPGYARSLRDAGVRTALISLHATDAATSDREITKVEGAFARTTAGIDAALAAGIRVELSHVVHRANGGKARAFVEMVRERWGRRVRVRLAFVAPTGAAADATLSLVPRLAEVLPDLRAALAFAAEHRVPIRVVGHCGVPPCLLAPYERFSETYWRGRVETPDDHVKLPACASCAYDRGCAGLWKGYLEAHGDPGIAPLVDRPFHARIAAFVAHRLAY